jgi:hypothetical protein
LFWFFWFFLIFIVWFCRSSIFSFFGFFILLTNAFSFPFLPFSYFFVSMLSLVLHSYLLVFFAYVHFIALAYFNTPCSSFAPICSCLLAYPTPCSSLFIAFIYFDVPNLFHESHLLVSWEL